MHQHLAAPSHGRPMFRARRAAVTALVVVLTSAVVTPLAAAEDLDALRSGLVQVQRQQAETQQEIAESAQQVNSATARLNDSQNALAGARARLSDMQVQLAAARAVDANLAIRLKAEQAALEEAVRDVSRGEAELADQLRLMGVAVRDAYQQHNPLEGLSVVFDAGSTSDLSQRIQWSTTIFDTQAAEKVRLDEVQRALAAARDRQAAIEAEVAEQKAAAARQVGVVRALERAARAQTAAVEALVVSNQAAQVSAKAELDADRASYDRLKAQEDGLQAEIQGELARLKAEAERRAREEAARKAAEQAARKAAEEEASRKAAAAAAARKASEATSVQQAAERAASATVSASRSTSTRSASDPTGYGVSRVGLIRPVAAGNGSAFGLRFHPILKYWRMHNGTDFGATSGTPLYAAADGIVLKAGPNGGFGNFVLVGHDGLINGRYVTTGYAHQSRIVVGVGQRVRQGQLIGYVGNTGLSTTPHLHLEVRLDGAPANPMTYIP